MLKFFLKRCLASIPSLCGVVVVTFLLTRALPGDPAVYFAGPIASYEAIEEVRESLGLNKPMIEQFVLYIKDLAHGDWGTSLTTGRPVTEELLERLPASLELTLFALVITMVIAFPLGIVSATRKGSWVDHLSRVITTAGVSLPVFFTGLVLVYLLYYVFNLFPSPSGRIGMISIPPDTVTGFYLLDSLLMGDLEKFFECLSYLFLPALTLGIFALAPIARMTRASMLEVLSSDYIRTARASGLSQTKILFTYALRNAMLPVITTLGMVFSFLLGANVLVEKVFAWPGIGLYALESLISSDYAPIQGFVLSMGLLYVVLNLVIDLIYGIINPRIRLEA